MILHFLLRGRGMLFLGGEILLLMRREDLRDVLALGIYLRGRLRRVLIGIFSMGRRWRRLLLGCRLKEPFKRKGGG